MIDDFPTYPARSAEGVLLGPFPQSYWVREEQLLAGQYPGSVDPGETRLKLERLLEAGVDFFLDLTFKHELEPYIVPAARLAAERGRAIEHRRLPIIDMGVPPPERMVATLDVLDAALDAGRTPYVHCWGGLGRTGMVVACWLIRQGHEPEAALRELERLRAHLPGPRRASPQTPQQVAFVLNWREPSRRSRT